MDTQTLIYIFVGLSFSLYIGIAIWSRAGSTKEFYCCGRRGQSGRQRHGNRSRLDVSGKLYLDGRYHRLFRL